MVRRVEFVDRCRRPDDIAPIGHQTC